MRRRLALACVVAGCGFSTNLAPTTDAPVDGRAGEVPSIDAAPGSEPAAMPVTTTFTSVADVYLRTSVSPDENTNSLDYFIVDGDLIATGLVRFDLGAIPSTATVMTAELMLYVDGDSGDGCNIYPLLESWDEATVTSNQRATGTAWLGAGATPPSRGNTTIATFTPAMANTVYTIALATTAVQGWVATPASNFGVAITTTNSNGARFGAREKAAAMQRPALRVTYVP